MDNRDRRPVPPAGSPLATVSMFVALLFAVLTGCGGGGGGQEVASAGTGADSPPAADAPAADSLDRARQYVACLRGQGIDVPDPAPGGRGKVVIPDRDQPGLEDALRACQRYAPDAATDEASEMAKARAYAACMRENGLPQFPDPDPDKGPVFPKDLQSNPGYEDADRACAHHLDQGK